MAKQSLRQAILDVMDKPMTYHDIARLSGRNFESVRRTMRNMYREGLVTYAGTIVGEPRFFGSPSKRKLWVRG